MSESSRIADRERLCELAPVARAPLRHHVFVCNGKSCSAVDSSAVKQAFYHELKARGLLQGKAAKGCNPKGEVVLSDCSSVGFCAIGSAVLVYPDGIWYAQVQAADVAEIVDQHLVNGKPVERLLLIELKH